MTELMSIYLGDASWVLEGLVVADLGREAATSGVEMQDNVVWVTTAVAVSFDSLESGALASFKGKIFPENGSWIDSFFWLCSSALNLSRFSREGPFLLRRWQ